VKISVLCHDVSETCITRSHLLARMLVTEHETEIVGPASNGRVWGPLGVDHSVPVRVIPRGNLREMAAAVDGDVLYAVKPRPMSLGLALAAQRQRLRPLLVDVDDWESGFLYDDLRTMLRSGFRDETRWVVRNLLDVRTPNNPYRTARTERRVVLADAVTTSSTWLAARYAGSVIGQARDLSRLDPASVDRDEVRAELGIPADQVVLLFMGRPRRHKGVRNVLAALDVLQRPELLLLSVGGDPQLPPRPDLRVMGWKAQDQTSRFLAAADMVVLAHDPSPGARGQMPMKLYDALAMGKPVIVTDVSDMAATVIGCGLVVPPRDVGALAAAIGRLADDPALRRQLGDAGRERCVRLYSDDAVRPALLDVLDLAIARNRLLEASA
jgi:glycosyltransferase involved in cell wall biosynthesis